MTFNRILLVCILGLLAVLTFSADTTANTSSPAMGVDPMLGEIMWFAGNFAPRGWMKCDGQLLAINQYQALFSILGTTYGGDGRTTFGLPDLRGRVSMGWGTGAGLSNYRLGQRGGQETVTLTAAQMPVHTHGLPATGTDGSATGNVQSVLSKGFSTAPAQKELPLLKNAGGSQAHNNMPPYLTMTPCIAVQGVFPSRS